MATLGRLLTCILYTSELYTVLQVHMYVLLCQAKVSTYVARYSEQYLALKSTNDRTTCVYIYEGCNIILYMSAVNCNGLFDQLSTKEHMFCADFH